jgi:hypothetical protein
MIGGNNLTMKLNIPEASKENDPKAETAWLNTKEIPVGESITIQVDRVHVGEKAVCFFDDDNNQAISLFHVSDFEGETLGVRALIALGQALKIEGDTDVDAILESFDEVEKATMTFSNTAFETKDGEARTYKRITFKV